MAMENVSSKIKHAIFEFAIDIKNIGMADPRRITHSLKVALAITMVSMIYFLQLFYNSIGNAGIWAILTVVMVLEYTVGATLSKGLNRGFATLLAGVLGVGTESFADLFGSTVKPIVLGLLLFIIVALATFSRFIPNVKKRYDYGVVIFILTFALVAVSGYRVDKIVKLAHQRLTTIVFSCTTCVLISMFVCPVWAGEELHKLIVNNLEKLAKFLEGSLYIKCAISAMHKPSYTCACICMANYNVYSFSIHNFVTFCSISNEQYLDAQEIFAWWEIGHGKFRFRHPWKKYLEIGVYTRQCVCHVEAFSRHLKAKYEVLISFFLQMYAHTRMHIYAPSEFQKAVKASCMKMSLEVGKALKELGSSMRLMIYPSGSVVHIENCRKLLDELKSTLKVSMVAECDILETISVITAASILVEIIKCVETISKVIEELSKQAHFKRPKDITSDKTEEPHFLNRDSPKKPVEDGKNEKLITITVLLDDGIGS
ncbi:aluminum-activated malate transporter 8-like [Bidens hawaiensis]|uniref:aluminum-activated malate transporter 8-like n=1 Tax=Bidens hawaiensis TaxID=980011 RepID=UPI00404B3DE6